MLQPVEMRIIARIHSDFPSKFGIPRQSGLVDALTSTIVFEPDYRNPDALRGLEGYSHIWAAVAVFSSDTGGLVLYLCGRPAWAATHAWAYSPPVRPSARTPSAYPRYGFGKSRWIKSWALSCTYRAQI